NLNNHSQMQGKEIVNQGNLYIQAGNASSINANITSGIMEDGGLNYWSYLHLDLATNNLAISNGAGTYGTISTDESRISSYTGRLITNITDGAYYKKLSDDTERGAQVVLTGGELNLLSGSSAFMYLNTNYTPLAKNTLRMQDTFLRLTKNSNFTGTLTAIGNNELVAGEGSLLNLKDNSVFEGILRTDFTTKEYNHLPTDNGFLINISNSKLFLKANTSAKGFKDFGGFRGGLSSTTTTNNYLEMDSSVATSAGDWVVLDLNTAYANTSGTTNATYTGSLFTKGTKNIIVLGNYANFKLDDGSYFDGVLIAKGTSNAARFLNPDGDVTLENGSTFRGVLQANTLTLKGEDNGISGSANSVNGTYLDLYNNSYGNSTFKGLQVLSGTHTLLGLTSKELTATINNIGGRLSMNFIGSNTAVPTDATNNPIHFQG
ncbi:hypothetical protein, partial [Helicobacter sp. 13S00482-2]|uniref:hypothetical protein n=1 Tax=Helicobacter sp. 13S00482-2 TaxID=1476200 RepID=UPI001C5FA1B3